ncbi:hypothetical protein D920_01714 [Enterococcus faecalis 13-SD-W-01]|nr:hypothetical protein D920_01714 [Enterococcus faecalis 13-SD-W-01]
MAKINLNIEAETTEELQKILKELTVVEAIEVATSQADTDMKKEATKPKKAKTKKAATKKQEEVSTESTADAEPSKTGDQVEPTEIDDNDVEKTSSATVGKYPGATKVDVQKAMAIVIKAKGKDVVKTAFGRCGASKLSELKEEDYSAFITDLEALSGIDNLVGD